MAFRKKTAKGPGSGHRREPQIKPAATFDEKLQRYVWPHGEATKQPAEKNEGMEAP